MATGAFLAPSINYGMSHHHSSFPGTVTLRPATFVAVMRDVAYSLSKTGFTHVLFVNGELFSGVPAATRARESTLSVGVGELPSCHLPAMLGERSMPRGKA